MKHTNEEYTKLNQIFTGGDISLCSQKELEKFAVMLSRPRANEHFGASSFPQICETIRTLIFVRMSEKANRVATIIAIIALAVAVAALLFSGVQAYVSLNNIQRAPSMYNNLSSLKTDEPAKNQKQILQKEVRGLPLKEQIESTEHQNLSSENEKSLKSPINENNKQNR